MPRFFVSPSDIYETDIRITGDNYRHLSGPLRARVHDEIVVCDNNSTDYHCKISEITATYVIAQIISKNVSIAEPNNEITLFMAMPKGDKPDLIIEKCVEIGIYEIVFFISKFCTSRPDEKSMAKKLVRYSLISQNAAKQSGRGIIPKVSFSKNITTATKNLDKNIDKIIFYEGNAPYIKPLLQQMHQNKLAIMIGSEGGFDKDEVELAIANGFKSASLGNRILRCETAPISALSIILYEKEIC